MVKKVPYRIEQQEEGDMFDTFSCSMDVFDAYNQTENQVYKTAENIRQESHRAPAQFILPDDSSSSKQDEPVRISMISELPEVKPPAPENLPTLIHDQFSQMRDESAFVKIDSYDASSP